MERQTGATLDIEGHTDNVVERQLALSVARASSKGLLTAHGVEATD